MLNSPCLIASYGNKKKKRMVGGSRLPWDRHKEVRSDPNIQLNCKSCKLS